MRCPEQQRFAAFKVQKHKQFYKVGADDSDVTDIDSEEEVILLLPARVLHVPCV